MKNLKLLLLFFALYGFTPQSRANCASEAPHTVEKINQEVYQFFIGPWPCRETLCGSDLEVEAQWLNNLKSKYSCEQIDRWVSDSKTLLDFEAEVTSKSSTGYSLSYAIKRTSSHLDGYCYSGINPRKEFEKIYNSILSNAPSDYALNEARKKIESKYYSCRSN